jgi:ADP-ribose pyrophosphatase YjhB (NUDIX family)
MEETALQVVPIKMVEVFERILHDEQSRVQYHYVLLDYLCRVDGGEAQAASDVTELRWLPAEELESLSVAPDTCAVIRKAISSLGP